MVNNSDIGQAILLGIERINDRLDRMDDRLDRMELRIDSRMSAVESRMSALDSRMSKIEDAVADIDVTIKTWPDMHYLASAAKSQITHLLTVKGDMAELKTRL